MQAQAQALGPGALPGEIRRTEAFPLNGVTVCMDVFAPLTEEGCSWLNNALAETILELDRQLSRVYGGAQTTQILGTTAVPGTVICIYPGSLREFMNAFSSMAGVMRPENIVFKWVLRTLFHRRRITHLPGPDGGLFVDMFFATPPVLEALEAAFAEANGSLRKRKISATRNSVASLSISYAPDLSDVVSRTEDALRMRIWEEGIARAQEKAQEQAREAEQPIGQPDPDDPEGLMGIAPEGTEMDEAMADCWDETARFLDDWGFGQ